MRGYGFDSCARASYRLTGSVEGRQEEDLLPQVRERCEELRSEQGLPVAVFRHCGEWQPNDGEFARYAASYVVEALGEGNR